MQKPHVIQISMHDTGRWFGCYDVPGFSTPAIDRLAAKGVRCNAMFSPEPICSPSRASLATGLAPPHHGVMGLAGADGWRLREGVTPLGAHLRTALGYRTALFGVQHEHPDIARLGFDQQVCGQGNRADAADQVADAACRWIADHVRRADAQPFYVQVGFYESHTPYGRYGQPPDDPATVHVPPYVVDDAAARDHIAGLQGMIRAADGAVAKLLGTLDQLGLAERTLIHFVVDHGPELPRAKWTLYDAGVRTASIWRYPAGGVAGGRVDEGLRTHADAMPTILDLIRPDAAVSDLDGRSFARSLRGEADDVGHDHLIASFHLGGVRSVRTRTHKLIRTFLPQFPTVFPGRVGAKLSNEGRPLVELFDLRADPWETHNLADDPAHCNVRRNLSQLLWSELQRLDDPVLRESAPTPTWHLAMSTFRQDIEAPTLVHALSPS